MNFRRIIALFSVAGMLLAGSISLAQTITGRITGAVTDPSGAAIPNATVTAKNLATGVQASTRSDQERPLQLPVFAHWHL